MYKLIEYRFVCPPDRFQQTAFILKRLYFADNVFQKRRILLSKDVVDILVQKYTCKGNIVIDPYDLYGQTAMACVGLSRRCFSFDDDWCEWQTQKIILRFAWNVNTAPEVLEDPEVSVVPMVSLASRQEAQRVEDLICDIL